MSNEQELKKIYNIVLDRGEQAVRAVALQLFSAIIVDTPVDTGRLRGNWQCTIGSAANGELNAKDKTGGATVSAMEKVVNTAKGEKGFDLFLTNNLPYAESIENGHSKQRPYGMVKVNITKFGLLVEKAQREVNK